MVIQLMKGDAVSLSEPLEVAEEKDANNKSYLITRQLWNTEGYKPPYAILDAYLGMYLGNEYVPMFSRKSENGRIQSLKHCFFFNGCKVFIDPKFVTVQARLDDSEG